MRCWKPCRLRIFIKRVHIGGRVNRRQARDGVRQRTDHAKAHQTIPEVLKNFSTSFLVHRLHFSLVSPPPCEYDVLIIYIRASARMILVMTLFSSPSYTTMPRNRGYLFATDARPPGRTVYLPVPFRLIILMSTLSLTTR
jgi:hypothetical protein